MCVKKSTRSVSVCVCVCTRALVCFCFPCPLCISGLHCFRCRFGTSVRRGGDLFDATAVCLEFLVIRGAKKENTKNDGFTLLPLPAFHEFESLGLFPITVPMCRTYQQPGCVPSVHRIPCIIYTHTHTHSHSRTYSRTFTHIHVTISAISKIFGLYTRAYIHVGMP